jgi:hypothetical protein
MCVCGEWTPVIPMGGVIAALYGGAPDGGSVSLGGSGGSSGTSIGITKITITITAIRIAAVMMSIKSKVFFIDIYFLSSLSLLILH